MTVRGSETVEVHRPTPKDRFGDPVGPEAMLVVAELRDCIIYPRMAGEFGERGAHTVAGLHVAVPQDAVFFTAGLLAAEAELRSTDTVLARGEMWKIDGSVGDWRKKDGTPVIFMFETMRPEDA